MGDNALTASGGVGWVDGVTYERSPKDNLEAVQMLLDLGLDPNCANNEGRSALMGAALKGRPEVIQLLVDRGAKLDLRDRGSRDTHIPGATVAGLTFEALDYAEGLVRVGVQSAVERPEAADPDPQADDRARHGSAAGQTDAAVHLRHTRTLRPGSQIEVQS